MEPEPEPKQGQESELETELEPPWDWDLKPFEELVYSDLSSRFDNDPDPCYSACPLLVYKNKIKPWSNNKRMQKRQWLSIWRSLVTQLYVSSLLLLIVLQSVVIWFWTAQPLTNVCGNNFPKPMDITDDDRPFSLASPSLLWKSTIMTIRFQTSSRPLLYYIFVYSFTQQLHYSSNFCFSYLGCQIWIWWAHQGNPCSYSSWYLLHYL